MDSPTAISNPSGTEDALEQTVERYATISESSSPSLAQWRPRRKSVSNACERCRGRKIRCDGETPCATCNRFSITCVRLPKYKDRIGSETQAALANRVQRLEARLAEMTRIQPGSDVNDERLMSWHSNTERSAQPSLRLDTSFEAPPHSVSMGDGFGGMFSVDGVAPLDIPTIEITQFEAPSPTPLSPVPSLLSAASGSSTPEPYPVTTPILGSRLAPPMLASTVSPPISACLAPTWESLSYENPKGEGFTHGDLNKRALTRHSSISSLGLDQDFNLMDLEFPKFEDELQSPGGFSQSFAKQSVETTQTAIFKDDIHTARPPMPTRFEAETLSDIFFERIDPHSCPIDRSLFQNCLDLVYNIPANDRVDRGNNLSGFQGIPYSLGMARFHVFIAMAIGMRMRTDGRGTDAALLENCYQLGIQQATSSNFWEEIGAMEAAFLLEAFARTSDVGYAQQ